ncbi:MAG TPA: universal stress protein [Terracidiphilus sp.]|jgi:nucleotide-binding universal stress UspA family protein
MSFANGLQTIVVATGLDGRADGAIEYARKFAAAYKARIILAHGADPVEYACVERVPGKVLSRLSEQARAVLDQMSEDLIAEGIHTHSEIRQGEMAQMLIDVAAQYEAGLIVIGTEGRQGTGPILVGSIAEQLVRIAPCAVLAVAADYNAGSYRPVPGGPVMLAMERNETAPEAVATASSLAETFHRTLIVVHARRPAEAVAFLNPMATTPEEFGIANEARHPVRCIVKDGKPGDAIVDAIAQYQPSLLVLGVKRTSETLGPHGTAFTILARSRVPVLCVPPQALAAVGDFAICAQVPSAK